jgi:hypothetical protein
VEIKFGMCWYSQILNNNTTTYDGTFTEYVVACRAVAMQRPRDGRIYQGRFWATAR